MAEGLNVRISGKLRDYVEQQTGPDGLYESVSEYVRNLIRRDYEQQEEQKWLWLENQLLEGMNTSESEYITVSAEDVVERNRKNKRL